MVGETEWTGDFWSKTNPLNSNSKSILIYLLAKTRRKLNSDQLLKVAVRMDELAKRGPEACLKDTLVDHFGVLNRGLMRSLMEQRTFDPCNGQTSRCESGESIIADPR